MVLTLKRIKSLICFIVIFFFGTISLSWGLEESYWKLLKIIEKNTDEVINKKKAFIKVSVPGKSSNYHVMGWVDIYFNECPYNMIASGELRLIKEGKDTGELISVKNLPLEPIEFDNKNYTINNKFLGKKNIYKDELKPFIWLDIDGDGLDELIYSSVCGNRFSTHSTIFEYDEYGGSPKLFNPTEIRDLDLSKTPQRELTSHGSAGACHNVLQTFLSINSKYVLTKFLYQEDCFNQEFELVGDKWCLKKSYNVDTTSGKYVEKNIKFFSEDKCYLKEEFLLKYKADSKHFQ